VTSQEHFDSYEDSGVVVAADLVNELALEHAFGRPAPLADAFAAIHRVLEIDPPSAAQLRQRDVPGFISLAKRLREIFGDLDRGDLDAAASRLNALLAAHPAHPHQAKDHGQWRLHHHTVDAALVAMATAICAEGMARMVGAGADSRLGTCASDDCDRVFLDGSKNASRRFCSTTCQNRVKAAAFRRRQATSDGSTSGGDEWVT
jgi:predicted RNA-binding Zn ribbon-like protein